jgi:ribosomal protein S18 acetylase RimI-like enzyme
VSAARARRAAFTVRELRPGDLPAVIRLHARHAGERKPVYWSGLFREFVTRRRGQSRVGLAADDGDLAGYLLGEVRAFEFGSEPCGWIFAVGVLPDRLRCGIASALLGEAVDRFRAAGVARVRTMVRRSEVPVLSFFRSNGFAAGSFVQLERDLEPDAGGERRGRRG